MSMHIKNKGFTLIELLVVIAIIGILASVVLASLNSARAKGADAAIKSSLNNARAQAELYYDNTSSSYAGLCTADATILNIQNGVNSAGGTFACTPTPTATAYKLWSPLRTSATTWYCVDSTGRATTTITNPTATAAACP